MISLGEKINFRGSPLYPTGVSSVPVLYAYYPSMPCGNQGCDYTVKGAQARTMCALSTMCHAFTYWSCKAFLQKYRVNDIHIAAKSQSATQVIAYVV